MWNNGGEVGVANRGVVESHFRGMKSCATKEKVIVPHLLKFEPFVNAQAFCLVI